MSDGWIEVKSTHGGRRNRRGNYGSGNETNTNNKLSTLAFDYSIFRITQYTDGVQSEQSPKKKMEFRYYPNENMIYWLPDSNLQEKYTLDPDKSWRSTRNGRTFLYRIIDISEKGAVINRFVCRNNGVEKLIASEFYSVKVK